jgi:hypothetical protein
MGTTLGLSKLIGASRPACADGAHRTNKMLAMSAERIPCPESTPAFLAWLGLISVNIHRMPKLGV